MNSSVTSVILSAPNRLSKRIALAVIACITALCSMSILAGDYDAIEARIAAALTENAGGAEIKVASIVPAEAKGLLEVTLESGLVLYATETGDHFVAGDLFALRPAGLVNLAEEKREVERKVLVDALEMEDMIVFSPEGDTRDYITVFTDVTCFYCQKLHREVDDLNNKGIEVRYLAYPRGGLDSDGARKLATAWCADDKQEALTRLKAGTTLPINACESAPIAAQYQLGATLGIRGTPAIVTSAGQMIPGYKSADDLEAILGLN